MPVRLLRRFETRVPLLARAGATLSAAHLRAVARPDRSAYRGARGRVSRDLQHARGRSFDGDPRARCTSTRTSAGALSFRYKDELQRAHGPASDQTTLQTK